MRNFFRIASLFVLGSTLAYRGITWHQPSFYVIIVAVIVYGVSWFQD